MTIGCVIRPYNVLIFMKLKKKQYNDIISTCNKSRKVLCCVSKMNISGLDRKLTRMMSSHTFARYYCLVIDGSGLFLFTSMGGAGFDKGGSVCFFSSVICTSTAIRGDIGSTTIPKTIERYDNLN